MWILILAFTTLQETVSKYFIKRELRDWQTVDRFVGLRESSRPSEFYSEYYRCSQPNLSEILILFSVRQGLKLVQGEWNILKMGNPKYIGQCKLVRFKTIYIESLDTAASIPLMTDGIISVSIILILYYKVLIFHLTLYFKENMDTMIDYVSSKLTSYRSFSHDAIQIYGFSMKNSDNGAVKAKMSIKDGLRWVL